MKFLKLFRCLFGKHEFEVSGYEAARIAIVKCVHCKTKKVRVIWSVAGKEYYSLEFAEYLVDAMESNRKLANFLIYNKYEDPEGANNGDCHNSAK